MLYNFGDLKAISLHKTLELGNFYCQSAASRTSPLPPPPNFWGIVLSDACENVSEKFDGPSKQASDAHKGSLTLRRDHEANLAEARSAHRCVGSGSGCARRGRLGRIIAARCLSSFIARRPLTTARTNFSIINLTPSPAISCWSTRVGRIIHNVQHEHRAPPAQVWNATTFNDNRPAGKQHQHVCVLLASTAK